ncbi:hypothetical protein ACQ5SO_14695 [Rhodovulum sp. DZ06]|uniref:hypothetical protein n=1 Tax=Rhodovulum sp. DZ06 TaxID=3425126 RepID=UPI003D338600
MRSITPTVAVLAALGAVGPAWAEEEDPAVMQRLCDRCAALNALKADDPVPTGMLNCRPRWDLRRPTRLRVQMERKDDGEPVCECYGTVPAGEEIDPAMALTWRAPLGQGGAPLLKRVPAPARDAPTFRERREQRFDHYPDPATRPPGAAIPETRG